MADKKIRMGMVGGGSGAFIGAVHRIAANLDGQIQLVCGAFSSDATRSRDSGLALGLDPARCYASYEQMFSAEAALPADERMDFVAIVTPNHLHFDVASAAISHGFHVLSDKPATLNLQQALQLKQQLQHSQSLYALTHTYTGYPMVKQARHLVQSGQLGNIRKVLVEYTQGWLADAQSEQSKQGSWRLDPKQAGASCCVGDIGVHAANLTEYVSGLQIDQICADLDSVVAGRMLDDDASILLRFDNGARGVLLSSQIAVGDENNLRLRIYGDKASLDWQQMEPNSLWLKFNDAPAQLLRAGVGKLCAAAQQALRTPAGHPEGYLEAFANIYLNFAAQIRAFKQGLPASNHEFDVPGIQDAVRGMAFIEHSVRASRSEQKWHLFEEEMPCNK